MCCATANQLIHSTLTQHFPSNTSTTANYDLQFPQTILRSAAMASNTGITNVFGGGGIQPQRAFGNVEILKEVFDILEKGDCPIIDTAALYGESEEILGKAEAGKRFIIDTKTRGGFAPGKGTKETVIAEAENSKKLLGVNVDVSPPRWL
jgi:diketogulonate reductase-like aldo/keto reductase